MDCLGEETVRIRGLGSSTTIDRSGTSTRMRGVLVAPSVPFVSRVRAYTVCPKNFDSRPCNIGKDEYVHAQRLKAAS